MQQLQALLNDLEQKKAPEKEWHRLGFQCINLNQYTKAEAIYDRMCKNYRHSGIPVYYRGIARFLQGRFKEAYEDFKASRQLDMHNRTVNSPAVPAISYMEETIFPTRDHIRKNQEKLVHELNAARMLEFKVGANMLKTLHKWNSATPLYSHGQSQGGGYFLTLKTNSGAKGIAIDPGYDFYSIMRDLGLGIADIDAIIITHDHDDHTESMGGILSLLAKHNDYNKGGSSKVIDIFGSAGVLLKFHGLLNALDPSGKREINFNLMAPGSTITHSCHESLLEKYGFVLHVKSAYHRECWTQQESAVGLVMETNLRTSEGQPLFIGITGDTRKAEKLGQEYSDCQALLLNIGSMEKDEGKLLNQHLGMLGCINLLKGARLGKPLLAILTEFGEEFSGKRVVISQIIENWARPLNSSTAKEGLRVIPADINLEVRLADLAIRDTDTHIFFPYQAIEVDESRNDTLKYRFNG